MECMVIIARAHAVNVIRLMFVRTQMVDAPVVVVMVSGEINV